MYIYTKQDKTIVEERVTQFRDQVRRRLNGELSEDEFKHHRLRNGLYRQLHAYMLRVAVPYGLLSSAQIRMNSDLARKYDRGYVHFTTRQNIQFNWPKLQDTPVMLEHLAQVEMHAIQTSGNCIRNTTTDEFAGVARDELEDPRPWCELIRQWSTFHPEFNFLPRKFKIAVTGSPNDRAAIAVHDIGLQIVKHPETGEHGFRVLVGGGQGRTPFVAKELRSFLPKQDLLAYLEAALRVYNLFGRRDNKYKARIKILIHELGIDAYRDAVEEEFSHIEGSDLTLDNNESDRVIRYFQDPEFEDLEDAADFIASGKERDPAFAHWVNSNTVLHKKPGYAAIVISLKPHGMTPGDVTSDQLDLIADFADEYSFGEIVATHKQNLVLPHVQQTRLHELFSQLKAAGLGTPNHGMLTDMICCPGLDYCDLANARSITIAQEISNTFDDFDYLHDLGPVSLNISGCINACGHHHVGNIGILGVNRKGVENYQITLGGSSREDAAIGQLIGPGFGAEQVPGVIRTLLETYVANRQEDESFLATWRRIGQQPFKEAVYDTAG